MKPYPKELTTAAGGDGDDVKRKKQECLSAVAAAAASSSSSAATKQQHQTSASTIKQKLLLQRFKDSLDNDGSDPVSFSATNLDPAARPSQQQQHDAATTANGGDNSPAGIITSGEGICDPFVHLTNTSVATEFLDDGRRFGSGGGIDGDSNTKWTLKQLAENWDSIYAEQIRRRRRREEQQQHRQDDDYDDQQQQQQQQQQIPSWPKVWNKICDTLLRVLAVSESHIPAFHRSSAFELFGFDVLLDEFAHPWVLEVNSSPSMDRLSVLDDEVKPRLLDEILSLVQPTSVDFEALHQVLVAPPATTSAAAAAGRSSSSSSASSRLSQFSRVGNNNNNSAAWDSILNRVFPAGVSKSPLERVAAAMDERRRGKQQQPDDDDVLLGDADDELFGTCGVPRFEEFLQLAPSASYNAVVKQRRA